MKVKNIIWDTGGNDVEDLYLPHTVYVPSDVKEEDVADWLSNQYGFLVESFEI